MVVGCLRNTRIETWEKTCVLGECNTQIPSSKQGPRLCCFCLLLLSSVQVFLWLSCVQVKSKPAQSPITKKTERFTKDVPAHKPKNSNWYTWKTSRANRGKPLPCVEIRSLRGGKQSTALRADQIRSLTQSRGKEKTTSRSKMKISSAWGQVEQRKEASNQQI